VLTEQDRFLYLVDSVEHRQESRSENLGWFRREKVQDGTSEEPGEQQSPVNCQMTKDPKEPLQDSQQVFFFNPGTPLMGCYCGLVDYGVQIPAHQLGGPKKAWDFRGYGLSEAWVTGVIGSFNCSR